MNKSTVRLHPLTGLPLKPVGHVRGRPVWPILGGSEDPPAGDPPAGDPPAGDPPASDPPKDEKQLPQSKVNEIVARETAKAKKEAEEGLVKTLGVTAEEAAAIVKAHQDKADSEKSEAQKAREAADREKAEAEQAKQDAAREVFATRADRALIKAGAPADDDEALESMRGMLRVDSTASADDIVKDVKRLAEKFPGLFGGQGAGGTPPGNDPKKKQQPGRVNTDAYQRGLDRAKNVGPSREYPKPPGVPA